MRIRLHLLLPLAMALVVAAGFFLAGLVVGDAVREAAGPGPSAQAAAEHATRVVGVWGLAAVWIAALAGWLMARMIAVPLSRVRETAKGLAEPGSGTGPGAALTEIDEVARDMTRVAGELRDRHGRELKERAELAALVDAVSEGLMQLDTGGRVVRVNRAATRLLGLPADAVGRPIASLVRNAELRRLLESASRAPIEPAEVALDQARILVSVAQLPGGGVVAAFVDLTDLRRLEEVRRDFVANASHELKTPLTSIRGYTDTLLADDLPEAERKEFLRTVYRNAERLQRIVDDLLDLSRLEAGSWPSRSEPLSLAEAAESAWQPFAGRAADRGVAFELSAGPALEAVADARGLEQVLANLYDNALRHTTTGGRITVVARRESGGPAGSGGGWGAAQVAADVGGERGAAWVTLEVRDTGTGIPRDALPRIFERFYRVDPARSRAEGGTGLGLSIVRHLVAAMGGAVEARSELGKGTTIRLWLPAARDE